VVQEARNLAMDLGDRLGTPLALRRLVSLPAACGRLDV